eukprot:12212951-Karenia_brevis.AAC.1
MEELKEIIRQIKRHKTPGPDEIPVEMFKDMDEHNLQQVLHILNEWWTREDVPEEALLARADITTQHHVQNIR